MRIEFGLCKVAALAKRLNCVGLACLFGAVLFLSSCSSERKNGVLIVGTEATYPPFEMTDDSGNIVGFDIELIAAIAADQGLTLEFRDMDFDSLIPGLQAGNIDIVASGMSITDARKKQVHFTDPYIEAGLVVAVAKSRQGISGVDDLAGLRVAVQQGTTGASKAEELKKKGKIGSLKYFPNVSVAMMELLNGGADAIINDKPVTQAFVVKNPDKIKIVGGTLVSDKYGFAVSLANEELLGKLNLGLKNVLENGDLDTLVERYFED